MEKRIRLTGKQQGLTEDFQNFQYVWNYDNFYRSILSPQLVAVTANIMLKLFTIKVGSLDSFLKNGITFVRSLLALRKLSL